MQVPDAKTGLFCLIGYPVDHSLSPRIHNAAFEALQLNSIYLACPVELSNLQAALEGMKALSISGANVTSPHKEAVIPFLDSLSGEAEKIRSVNTIINRNGRLHGETTDGRGFYRVLEEAEAGHSAKRGVMVVGAGGAARAAAYSLASAGFERFFIFNRTVEKGQALSKLLEQTDSVIESFSLPLEKTAIAEALLDCGLIIYTLPHDEPEFQVALSTATDLCEGKYLFDLRYGPSSSAIIDSFKQKGGRAFNGLGMLFWQAAYAFELFTGQKAPLQVMRRAAGY